MSDQDEQPKDGRQDGSGENDKQGGSDEDQQQSGEGGQPPKQGDDEGDKDDAKKKPPIYKRPLFWIILIPIVAAIVIGGTLYYLHARQYESTDDAFVDAHIVRITAQNPGQVVQIANLDNRHVDAGRLLAVIEPSGPEAQLDQAQANVEQARAQYQQAVAQIGSAVASRRQAEAQARGPLADAVKAQQDLARYHALLRLDPNAVAGQQLDQARATTRSTAADARASRRQVDSAQAQVAVAERAARAAQTQIGAREAQVRQARVTLRDLRLTAPVSGQIVNRQVNLGSYVAPGTQLMALVPDEMWVTANFKETQLTLMKIGQPVDLHVDAYPDVTFHGHIDSVQRGAGQAFALLPPQNATGNYVKVVQRVPVRIVFDRNRQDAPDPLRYPIGPGMSVVPTVKVR